MAIDSLSAGHEALEGGAWEEARDQFSRAVEREQSGDAWEGLGWAAWWLADAELTFSARECAYRAYREEGDRGAAARVAAWLAADHLEFRGDEAVCNGWIERAHRVLEGLPRGTDHAWVALHECSFSPDMERKAELAREAAEIGRELGVADLEALGMALEGSALVSLGRVGEGMRRLDEASAVAAAEELSLPVSPVWTFCCMVSSCEGIGDFSRAAQWSQVMRAFSERWGGGRQALGVCRSAYGRVLATGGDWPAAEAELTAAVGELQAARPAMAAIGVVRLGELRARQGRVEEARELFEQAGPHPMGIVGLGALALDEGDAAGAADAAERVLRNVPENNTLNRMPALELLVRAKAALGHGADAEGIRDELQRTGAALGTPYLIGRARLAAAELALARGDHEEARRAAEDAVDRFGESAAPYDCGLARLQLARALLALGRGDRAAAEAEGARSVFAQLGAERDVARADELMAAGDGDEPEGPAALSELTARELDVLRLVAQGLSDAEIAERLFLSPHTVHRHVANVRAKLRLPSRAAAVAYAARAGLL